MATNLLLGVGATGDLLGGKAMRLVGDKRIIGLGELRRWTFSHGAWFLLLDRAEC